MNDEQQTLHLDKQWDWALIGSLALLKVLLHLPVLSRYGYHHDELYFIACGQHLSFGYFDHAPLVPWIARLANILFGESLFGLRIFSVSAGAAAVFITGLIVKRLGGSRFAQATACLAMIIAPVYLRAGNLLCLPAFEVLFWSLCFYFLVRILQEDNPRLWPWFGLMMGFGLLNKHSMLFLGFGLVTGLLLTPQRKHFKSPWLYAGGAIAFLMILPNLIWQMRNGWPTLGFLIKLNAGVMSGISLVQFLLGQILYLHPLNTIIWMGGLVYFFRKRNISFRLLGWIWLAIFLILAVTKSKIYYLAPAYPPLLAAGSIALDQWLRSKAQLWLKPAVNYGGGNDLPPTFARRHIRLPASLFGRGMKSRLATKGAYSLGSANDRLSVASRGTCLPIIIGLLFIGGTAMAPLSLPILPIDSTERYINALTFGAFKNIYELTADLRGMFGWRERVNAVAQVYRNLTPEEQRQAIIFASSYGNAGAIDYFGKAFGLPKATSLDMSYWLWGNHQQPFDTVIGAGFDPETMKKVFQQVTIAARVELKNVNPWQTPFYVTICQKPSIKLQDIWHKNRPW